ncbi:MAG: 2-oxo acid dehydrogenase subunit E2 [Kouleothrix sp.]
MQAAVAALQAVPYVNGSYTEQGIVLELADHHRRGGSARRGLIVPVVRDADEKNLLGLARTVNDLAERARTRRLKPDDTREGTFTITNHGVGGSLFATPIINQPQAAIMGIGAIQKRAVVISQGGVDAIAIRPMCYVSLTIDHRLLDGAAADRFLSAVSSSSKATPAERASARTHVLLQQYANCQSVRGDVYGAYPPRRAGADAGRAGVRLPARPGGDQGRRAGGDPAHAHVLQIDTIHAVARSPYPRCGAAWRLPGRVRSTELAGPRARAVRVLGARGLLSADREDFGLYRHRMLGAEQLGWRYPREWPVQNRDAPTRAVSTCASMARCAPPTERTDGQAGGCGAEAWRSAAPETLFTAGEPMIARRHNFQRIYDLRERAARLGRYAASAG